MESNKHSYIAILVSVGYLILSLFETQIPFLMKKPVILLGLAVLITLINISILMVYLFRRERIIFAVHLLLLLQLAVFCQLYIRLFLFPNSGSEMMGENPVPVLSDWVRFIAVHTLNAVDLLDITDAYNIQFNIIHHQNILSGIAVFSMYLMVSIFVLGILYKSINRSQPFEFSWTMEKICLAGLITATVITAMWGWWKGWFLKEGILWLTNNILYILDIGDGFQIFGKAPSLVPGPPSANHKEMGMAMATLAVFFRLIIGLYAVKFLNPLYLIISRKPARSPEDLIMMCTSPQHPVKLRIESLQELERLGTAANTVSPNLIKLLLDKNSDIVKATIEALEKTDSEWRTRKAVYKVIPNLVKDLENEDKGARITAIEILGMLGEQADEAIPALIDVLTKDDTDVRLLAAETLGKIGIVAIPELTKVLAGDDNDARRSAVQALKKIDPQWQQSEAFQKEIDRLADKLTTSVGAARRFAAETLGKLGTLAVSAVPDLIPVLADKDARYATVEALGKIGPGAKAAVPDLIKTLADEKARLLTVRALSNMGGSAKPAVFQLIEVLADRDRNIRDAAAEALKYIDPKWQQSEAARKAIPLFMGELSGENIESPYKEPAEALVSIGDLSIHHLVKALTDNNKEIIKIANQTLTRIDPQWHQSEGAREAVSHLAEALSNEEWYIRYSAAEVLGKIGPSAIKAVPFLVKILADPNKTVRATAKKSLEKITLHKKIQEEKTEKASEPPDPDKQEKEKIARLIKDLTEGDDDARRSAAELLGKIALPVQDAMPHLINALADIDADVRHAAYETLQKIDPKWKQKEVTQHAVWEFIEALANIIESPFHEPVDALMKIGTDATELLVKAMVHRNKAIANSVSEILEKIDPQWHTSEHARNAVPELAKALSSEKWYVRLAAATVLGRIGPNAIKAVPHLVKAMADTNKTVRSTIKESLDKIAIRK